MVVPATARYPAQISGHMPVGTVERTMAETRFNVCNMLCNFALNSILRTRIVTRDF